MQKELKKKKITQVDRVLRILEILSEGREISLSQNPFSKEITLLEEMKCGSYKFIDLEVGLRALQKDMAYIKEYLGDNLTKRNNSYRLVKKEYLDDFFKDNHKEVRSFFHAISLIDQSVFGTNFKKYAPLLDSIKVQQKGIYLFLENPFENLKKLDLKDKLEKYIKNKLYIDITYYSDKQYNFKRVQAYKIIYQNGNWYLAVLTTEDYEINNGFKLLRLNFIEKVTFSKSLPSNFHENLNVQKFLDNQLQSLFTSFYKKFFIVKVEVSKVVARYFKVKSYLKSQHIITIKDENLIIEFKINDDMEIIPLVQMWLPHIKIIEPKRLKDKIIENIKLYNKANQN